MLRKLTFFVLLAAVVMPPTIHADDHSAIVIISHKNFSIDSVTKEQAKKLWLLKSKSLPGTSRLKVADQKKDSNIRKQFYKLIVGKSAPQLKAYWAKQIFMSKGYPPQIFSDDSEIIRWVTSTPGALGYVRKSVLKQSTQSKFLKILLTSDEGK